MLPLGDDNSLRRNLPYVNYILIAINIFVFFLEVAGGEEFILRWAFVPSRFLANPNQEMVTLFSAMFMHGGLMHLGGNMLYLWIFGDNVEDHFGKFKFILFYLLSGIAATFAQLYFTPTSTLPNVGASGAIAGVLGAYIIIFPHSKVRVMLGQVITAMPAYLVIGFWFVLQFAGGLSTSYEADVGGVAYMAHVGGFIAGVLLALILKRF